MNKPRKVSRFLKYAFSLVLGVVLIIGLFSGCVKEGAPLPKFSAESEGINGDRILFGAYTSMLLPGRYLLYTMDVDGTKLTKLLDIDCTERWVSAILSPDKSRVAFFSPNSYLSLVRIDSGEVTKLIEAPQEGKLVRGYIAWSPDSTKIAYTSNRVLYVINADGSDNKKLAEPNTGKWKGEIIKDQPRDLVWSADGKYILFDDFEMPYIFWVGYDILSECRVVYAVNVATTEKMWVAGVEFGSTLRDQAPDRSKVLVSNSLSDNWSVLTTTDLPDKEFELPEEATVCKWSLDGSMIACDKLTTTEVVGDDSRFRHGYKLWTVDATTGETIAVADEIEELHSSDWSPDGSIIACIVGQYRNLSIVDASTGEMIAVADEIEGVRNILWSPDSQHLAYVSNIGIHIVRRDLSHGFLVYRGIGPKGGEKIVGLSLISWLPSE